MAWTYDPSTDLGKVRLLIGDTDTTDQQLQDAEVQAYLTLTANSVYGAAVAAARGLAAKYSRQADITIETVSKSNSQKARAYLALATQLGLQAGQDDANMAGPAAGGVSLGDMATADADTDRPPSQTTTGMFDNQGTDQTPTDRRRC